MLLVLKEQQLLLVLLLVLQIAAAAAAVATADAAASSAGAAGGAAGSPAGGVAESAGLALALPVAGGVQVAPASQVALLAQVHDTWKALMERTSVGLVDPKAERGDGHALAAPPLSAEEAWHHWSAAQEGVVDSARLLIAFSLAPSLLSGGSDLHVAAALGDTARLAALLDDVDAARDVDQRKEVDGSSALHAAAAAGHVAAVRLLLSRGADVEARGNDGCTALMLAAALGHRDVAVALLEGGAGVGATHAFSRGTALHFAAEMGHVPVLEVLCGAGASSAARKSNGATALHVAADCNQTAAAVWLVEHCGADTEALLAGDTTALYVASQRGLTGLARALLARGARANFEMPEDGQAAAQHARGLAPLGDASAARAGQWYAARNVELGNGATALHAACENGHLATAAVLLEGGARSAPSMQGATPLITSIQYGHCDIAELVLRRDRDPLLDARVPRDGTFALLAAVEAAARAKARGEPAKAACFRALLREMVARGADRELATPGGATALGHAASVGDLESVQALLALGCRVGQALAHAAARAEPDAPTLLRALLPAAAKESQHRGARRRAAAPRDGPGPLHVVERRDSLALLLAARLPGLDVNERDAQGATPLMLAALKCRAQVCSALLEHGADAALRAGPELLGATALYMASDARCEACVRALLGARADISLLETRIDQFDATPLLVAAERGAPDVVRALLDAGANRTAVNSAGLSPLLLAVRGDHVATVQALLRGQGAEAARADAHSPWSALVYALRQGRRVAAPTSLALLAHVPASRARDAAALLVQGQASDESAHEPRDAAQLLAAILRAALAAPLHPAILWLAAHGAGADAAARDAHSSELLATLLDSHAWAAMSRAQRVEALTFRPAPEQPLALQILVRDGRVASARKLVLVARALGAARELVHAGGDDSAASFALTRRLFVLLSEWKDILSPDQPEDEHTEL